MSAGEIILSSLLVVSVVLCLYFLFKGKVDGERLEPKKYTLPLLCSEMKEAINSIVNMDVDGLNLNRRDMESRKAMKRSLSNGVRRCSQGDRMAKAMVIARMKAILANKLMVTEEHVDEVISFHKPNCLTNQDKFEILLYLQKKQGNHHMFGEICRLADWDQLKYDGTSYYYEITSEDLDKTYTQLPVYLTYDDKLNVITQRIYEETYGLSTVDILIMEDDSIDGVSGGISGITKENAQYAEEDTFMGKVHISSTYESIWVIYGGKPIHMKCLSFKTQSEMVRICKNLSEHGRTGHLTSSEGGLKTHLVDGSRVVVYRPNNASQWAFFIRKCANTAFFQLEDLIIDRGNEYPIGVIRWAVRGCVNLFFSGDQNSGKTTNTRAAVREIDRRQPIRTMEADFELYLNDAYADKNILGTRPSERLPFPKLIELLKASDAHTILFGETASLDHAKHLINLLLAGTKRVITTGHWSTAEDIVSYYVHAMEGFGSSGTEDVESLVSRLIHLDVHCVKENDGHRHIDRITEIVPYERVDHPPNGQGIEGKLEVISHYLKLLTGRRTYETRDLIVYREGEYHVVKPMSERLVNMILKHLAPEHKEVFIEFNQQLYKASQGDNPQLQKEASQGDNLHLRKEVNG